MIERKALSDKDCRLCSKHIVKGELYYTREERAPIDRRHILVAICSWCKRSITMPRSTPKWVRDEGDEG